MHAATRAAIRAKEGEETRMVNTCYAVMTSGDAAAEPGGCATIRFARLEADDGSSIEVQIWRLGRPASLQSYVPHDTPFAYEDPDLYVSEYDPNGNRVVVKVLTDGTTIMVRALGPNALGFAGWPTTTLSQDHPTAQTAAQSADQLAALAAAAASQLVANR